MGGACGSAAVEDQEELDFHDGHVRCLSRPRHFPQRAHGTGEGGECLLFLEQASSVPYRDPVRDFTCHAVNSRSHGSPSVRAWVESPGGERAGTVAEWPAKHCNEAPSWYSARSLGLPLARQRASGATLCLEMRDGAEVLGSLRVPLREIQPHHPTTRPLEMEEPTEEEPAEERCRVTFQILDSRSVLHHRRVFLVRHGESVWNKAQSRLDLQTMASAVDHPLSEEGRAQAEALGERLAAAAKQRDANGMAMLRPDVVYVSPLTRAFQTAAIALGPLLAGRARAEGSQAEFVVMANAREKQTLGGFDTWSTEIGEDVPKRTLAELRALYGDDDDKGVLSAFSQINVDAQEVQDCWWVDGAETSAQLDERLHEFMSQLLFSPHRTIIVVGHSMFFREVLRRFLCDDFRQRDPEFCRGASSRKITNCGVVMLNLDPTRAIDEGPIASAEFVLGTGFEEDKGPGLLAACCAAPEASAGSDEEFLESPAVSLQLSSQHSPDHAGLRAPYL